MNRLELLTLGVILSLIISLAINVLVLVEVQKISHSYQELSHAYAKLSKFVFISAYLKISSHQYSSIALKYGGWNETNFKDMEVTTALYYVKFYSTAEMRCFEVLHKIADLY